MRAEDKRQDILDTERHVLQTLCQGTAQGSVKDIGRAILHDYRWRDPVHHAIFGILIAIPTADPEVLRNQLPVRLTRKGFPDFDIEDLFEPHSLSKEEAERLMRQLRDSR